MIYNTSITSKGQMTIPQAVREELGFYGAAKVTFDFDKKTKTFKLKERVKLEDLAGFISKDENRKVLKKHKVKSILDFRKLMETHYERT